MLDVSAQVLMSVTAASGWKMIALIEICLISCFVLFLVKKGLEFIRMTHWEPAANVRRLRSGKFDLLDLNNDNQITLDELVKGAPRLGLTVLQATILFQTRSTRVGQLTTLNLQLGSRMNWSVWSSRRQWNACGVSLWSQGDQLGSTLPSTHRQQILTTPGSLCLLIILLLKFIFSPSTSSSWWLKHLHLQPCGVGSRVFSYLSSALSLRSQS
mmetsp:Transcript_41756/g.71010  ORF Transcript_41756/g.71010 Transcript_41756/m.71010 type:complete len:213 (-) Transcript_41756:378-1016(-)